MAISKSCPATKCEFCHSEVPGDRDNHLETCFRYHDHLIETLRPAAALSKRQKRILNRPTKTKNSVRALSGGLPSLPRRRK